MRATYHLHQPYVMWAGTIEPRKNLPTLLEAFRRLDRHGLDLVLVGPRGWNEDLESHVGIGRRPGPPARVRPRGRQAGPAGRGRGVLPAQPAEGFGLPVLEAMAQGVPVVTSQDTAAGEVARRRGVLVDPLDAPAWPRRWRRCSTTPPGRRAGARRRGAGPPSSRGAGPPSCSTRLFHEAAR